MVAKLWDNLRHDVRMFWLAWLVQFRAATELRGAFVLQVVGMIANNTGLLVAWLFLFTRFGTINGWAAPDLIGVQGVNMVIFGSVMLFNNGFTELSRYVDQGAFDAFLTRPMSVLAQVASSRIEIATCGDLIMGVSLLVWYAIHVHAGLAALGLFVLAYATGVMILWCFTLLPYLLAFYLLDTDKVARNISMFFLDTGIYPSGVLSGALRTVLLTAFPGLLVGVVPLDVLRGIRFEYVAIGAVVTAVWLAITLWAFKRSLRRYESANLVGAR